MSWVNTQKEQTAKFKELVKKFSPNAKTFKEKLDAIKAVKNSLIDVKVNDGNREDVIEKIFFISRYEMNLNANIKNTPEKIQAVREYGDRLGLYGGGAGQTPKLYTYQNDLLEQWLAKDSWVYGGEEIKSFRKSFPKWSIPKLDEIPKLDAIPEDEEVVGGGVPKKEEAVGGGVDEGFSTDPSVSRDIYADDGFTTDYADEDYIDLDLEEENPIEKKMEDFELAVFNEIRDTLSEQNREIYTNKINNLVKNVKTQDEFDNLCRTTKEQLVEEIADIDPDKPLLKTTNDNKDEGGEAYSNANNQQEENPPPTNEDPNNPVPTTTTDIVPSNTPPKQQTFSQTLGTRSDPSGGGGANFLDNIIGSSNRNTQLVKLHTESDDLTRIKNMIKALHLVYEREIPLFREEIHQADKERALASNNIEYARKHLDKMSEIIKEFYKSDTTMKLGIIISADSLFNQNTAFGGTLSDLQMSSLSSNLNPTDEFGRDDFSQAKVVIPQFIRGGLDHAKGKAVAGINVNRKLLEKNKVKFNDPSDRQEVDRYGNQAIKRPVKLTKTFNFKSADNTKKRKSKTKINTKSAGGGGGRTKTQCWTRKNSQEQTYITCQPNY